MENNNLTLSKEYIKDLMEQIQEALENNDFEQVQNEVLAHLQRELGSQVIIRVQLEVTNDSGFDEKTVRDVNANADTLRFDDHGFA